MGGTSYLATLNPEQRRAVEHGVATTGSNIAGPLLVIAGAGSGKTSTLAHRVAHLIVHGADPGRILLLTFSRRAAADMERRAQRIIANAVGEARSGGRSPISWSGTFHAIGARILRMYAGSVGLDPAFTIHDREDSADLLNLVRHEQGLSEKAKRFPLKSTCLAIYSRAVNAAEALDVVLAKQFPWCAEWESDLRNLFDGYVEAKQRQHVLDYDDLLLYWGELIAAARRSRCARSRAASTRLCRRPGFGRWQNDRRTAPTCSIRGTPLDYRDLLIRSIGNGVRRIDYSTKQVWAEGNDGAARGRG